MGGGPALVAPRRVGGLLLVLAMVVSMLMVAPAARADYPMPPDPNPMPPPAVDNIYPAVFPVIGDVSYSDTYGACRGSGCSRGHLGVDIMARGVKGLPVVASAAGTISWISNNCCAMAINHDDDWRSYYIHLNNDTQRADGSFTDDGLGWGIAPGLERGSHVEVGQLIGWVGDSGNAENAGPHLHWELWAPDHGPVNPTPHADAAIRLPEPGLTDQDPPCPDGGDCASVALVDGGGQWHRRPEMVWGETPDSFFFGNPGDVAFVGDWDCDGVATPGLYRQSDGFVYLRNSNSQGIAEWEFFFGNPGDVPLVGDWNNDGCDTVSIYRPSSGRIFVINELGANGGGLGAAEFDFVFGNVGDVPFVGDFDGDGVDTVGLYRRSTGFVYFRDSLTSGVADLSFFYGDPGDVILAGDWNGDGVDTVAVYRPSNGIVYLNYQNAPGAADYTLYVGSYPQAVAG